MFDERERVILPIMEDIFSMADPDFKCPHCDQPHNHSGEFELSYKTENWDCENCGQSFFVHIDFQINFNAVKWNEQSDKDAHAAFDQDKKLITTTALFKFPNRDQKPFSNKMSEVDGPLNFEEESSLLTQVDEMELDIKYVKKESVLNRWIYNVTIKTPTKELEKQVFCEMKDGRPYLVGSIIGIEDDEETKKVIKLVLEHLRRILYQ